MRTGVTRTNVTNSDMSKKFKIPEIKVGSKFHWWDRDLWHIINIFEDEGTELVVLKSWAKYKQRWVFKVDFKDNLDWYFHHTYKEVLESKEEWSTRKK